MNENPPDIRAIRRARDAINGLVHRTPRVPSRTLSRMAGCGVTLKLENLQKTGSFKPRGALVNMMGMPADERARGVVTISAGNHAQGVAYAASVLGVPSTVVMPAGASPAKAEAARGYGAEVVLHGTVSQAFERMEEIRRERSLAFVHPFDAATTIAGQGTVGLEIMEDAPETDLVVVGIGGGGLISGVALAVKSIRPGARVVGVEPVGAPAMRRSLDQGEPACLAALDTIADGLAAPFAGGLNYRIVRDQVDDVVLVTDEEIIRAMRLLLERCKILAEPAGAAASAALLHGKITVKPETRAVCIVSGGNVAPEALAEHLSRA